MIDSFVLLAPVLLLVVIALLRFVGCDRLFGIEPVHTAPAAVAFDAVSNSTPSTGQTQSWMHTASGSNGLLVVVVHGNSQARSASSVTHGGMPLTRLTPRVDGGPGTFAWVEMWYLTGPPTGPQTITVTLDASDAGTWTATGISFTSVNQMTPLGAAFPATGGNTAPMVDVPSSPNDLVLDAVTYDDQGGTTLTVGTGQTPRRNDVASGQVGFGVSTQPGATTVTMFWTLSGARPWRQMGVSVAVATT